MPTNLLNIPYDVRHLIYQQLFPPEEQLYVQAHRSTLQSMRAERLPIDILLVSRQLHAETSGYLYNSYLFNIVGTKINCLATYEILLAPFRKYARSNVRIDVFSNGEHSATMCISLHAGESKTGVLDRRARGQRMTIQAMKEELDAKKRWPCNKITVYQPLSKYGKLALSALLAGQIVDAAIIPRQIVSVTSIVTHTVYAPAVVTSIHTIYYTPTSFKYSPTASSPASHPSSVTSSSKSVSSLSHATVHFPLISIIPIATYASSTASIVSSSSHSAMMHQSASSAEAPELTFLVPNPPASTTSPEHAKLTVTLYSHLSHTHSSTQKTSNTNSSPDPVSTGNSQGLIGNNP